MNWVREGNFLEVMICLMSLRFVPSSDFKRLENKTHIYTAYYIRQVINVIDCNQAWSYSCSENIYDEIDETAASR